MKIENSNEYVGPYTNRPFHPNIKCLIISGMIVIMYWYIPRRNIYLIPMIYVFSYTLIGWYDHIYKCDRRLYTGYIGTILDNIFKPQKIRKEDIPEDKLRELLPYEEQQRIYLRNVYLFHICVIVPILTYTGYKGKNSDPRVFGLILGLATLSGGYHGFRMIHPRI